MKRWNTIAVRNLLAILVFVILLFIAMGTAPDGKSATQPVPLAICSVFGDKYCGEALRVAWCESHLTTTARNGQYRGLFQMGSWERRKYGHGSDALTQARAAFRYFVASGKDWSPWSCKP